MSITLYMDVHVPYAITTGLRLRGVDVLTAQQVGARRLLDTDLLNRARELRRVLFTQDEDLLEEAAKRQRSGGSFAGVIYSHIERSSNLAVAETPPSWLLPRETG